MTFGINCHCQTEKLKGTAKSNYRKFTRLIPPWQQSRFGGYMRMWQLQSFAIKRKKWERLRLLGENVLITVTQI